MGTIEKCILLVVMVTISASFQAVVLAGDKKLQAGKVDAKMMVIKGDNAWQSTGLVVQPSDKVVVNASGQVFFSNGEGHSGVTPDGYKVEWYQKDYIGMDFGYCGDPMGMVSHAALIGRDSQGMFPIGRSRVVTGKRGPLFIGINDCSFKNEYHNTGEFKVNIKVMRGK
ncbi:MAG: hypothetical protein HUN04_06370 [Desulfobacter sp.]|nr:MAG: hypothetical protein HUN04_06370 [Desulfobacter sp.]